MKALHAAGATRVDVVVMHDEPRRIERCGGPYAERLMVYFTPEIGKDALKVVKSLQPDNYEELKDADWVDFESEEVTSLQL